MTSIRFPHMLLWVIICLLLGKATAFAATPWALPEWKYRRTVQIYNNGTTVLTAPVLSIDDLPYSLLISAGKLAEDGADLRLLDETGAAVPIVAENLLSDNGDARILVALPELKASERRLFTLYYGNPQPGHAVPLAAGVPTGATDVKIGVGVEESTAPMPAVTEPTLDRWLSDHLFREAESGKRDGFVTQTAGADLGPVASGGAVLAANGGQGSVSFEFDVDASAYVCWVRCLPGNPPAGTLMLSAEQGGHVLAPPADPFAGQTAHTYRWFPLRVTTAKGTLQIIARSEGAPAALDCLVLTRDVQYRPDYRDFQGLVWVRWRMDTPAEYRYWTKINNDWDPWHATFELTGSINPSGLLAEMNNMPFTTDADYFSAGQYSPWILLPTSKATDWHAVLFFPPKPGITLPDNLTVRLEFANRPAPERIFHITPAEPLELGTATCGVRMPTVTTLEGLQQLESFNEWALRRAAIVNQLHLSPPPRLTKLHVGTWDSLATRLGNGNVSRELAERDFAELEALGINSAYVDGIDDGLFGALAREHGMIATNWAGWPENWVYTAKARSGEYGFKDANEIPPQRWQRVLDDSFGTRLVDMIRSHPNQMALDTRINLGDEISCITTAEEIAKTPQLLAYYREWLKAHGLTPADFGVADWNRVLPLDDRKALGNDEGVKARAFYWTAQFNNDYTALFFRTASGIAQKYAGNHLTYANYQAGLMQNGFIGNNNDMEKYPLDIFHLGREKAFTAALTEDWINGWDMDIGRISLGNEMLRASVRKYDLPLANSLVGGQAMRARFYAMLMNGVKNIDLYLYGPISNIGPAWAEDPKALADIAAVTREIKPFEDAIADGRIRPRKAALLIAPTSDIMQKKDLYFLAERQALYLTLAHSNLPVDVVSEEEIEQDDALRNYSLLYVTDPNVREATQRKIAAWVQNGGSLWACVGGANWDEYNRPCTTLDAVFGVAKREMTTQEKWLPWSSSPYGPHPVKYAYEQLDTLKASSELLAGALEVPVWGVKLKCTPTTAQVLGRYQDGAPALLLNGYGRGQAMLVGALVGEAYVHQHYPDAMKPFPEMIDSVGKIGWSFDGGAPARRMAVALAASAKVTCPVALSIPGIFTSVMDSPQGTLLFLNNASAVLVTDRKEAQIPTITVRMPETRAIKSVTSAKTGALEFAQRDGEVTFDITLPDTDVIMLKL